MNAALTKNEFHDKIVSEQLGILYKNLLISIPANLLCATIMLIAIYRVTPTHLLIYWYATIILMSVLRLILAISYLHDPKYTKLHLYVFLVTTAMGAALWGFAGFGLMPENYIIEQMITIVVITGVTAGGIQSLQASFPASLIFIACVVLPLCIWTFLQNSVAYTILGFAITFYLLFSLAISWRGCRFLNTTLRLKYENMDLAESISSSNNQLKQTNQSLIENEKIISELGSMNNRLQLCQNLTEVYPVIGHAAQKLMAELSGGLTIFNHFTNEQETMSRWGENSSILKSTFKPVDCWALRSGNTCIVSDPDREPICHHFESAPKGGYLCLPLIVQNQVIAMLHFNAPAGHVITGYQHQIINNFSEIIKLSLTNISLNETFREQAIHDPLTGLFNRRYLNENLPVMLKNATHAKLVLCVCMLDLDFFKNINDQYGHDAGDEVLKFIGALLTNNFRGNDIACRYGGEEFIIVLMGANLNHAMIKIEYICQEIRNAQIYIHDRLLPTVTVSAGIAEAPKHGESAMEIIHAADSALYSAKQSGRNKIMLAQLVPEQSI